MARDVTTLIIEDHRELQRIFGRLRAGDGDPQMLFQQMMAMLEAHGRAEEAEVYPVIAETTGEVGEVRHARHEHAEADELVLRLRSMDPQSQPFGQVLHQLMDAVDEHIQEEETTILPALREAVDQRRLAELATAFATRRGEELMRGPSTQQLGES